MKRDVWRILWLAAICAGVLAIGAVPALATDTYEPNNDAAHATPVVNPGTYVSYVSTENDLDVYRLHLTPGNIMFSVTAPNSTMNMYLELYDSTYATDQYPSLLAQANDNGNGFPEQLSYSITSEGDYYVVAGAYSGRYSTSDAYALTFDGTNVTKFPVQARLTVPSQVSSGQAATVWLGLYSSDVALSGRQMVLQSSQDGVGGWTAIRTLTSSDHMLRSSVSPTRDTWYRLVFKGDAVYQGATSPIQKLTVPPSDTTPPTTSVRGADLLWHKSPVALNFTAADDAGGSGMSGGAAKVEYKLDSGAWTTGKTIIVPAPADHSMDGTHIVSYRSTDAAGNIEAAKRVSVRIDTSGPTTAAKAARGRKGHTIALRCQISDNLSANATGVRLVVRNAKGKLVKAFTLGSRKTATWYSQHWTPKARGTFRYYVFARDLAGNGQTKVGSAKVVVK